MFEARRAPRRKPAIHSPVVKVSTNWDVFAEMRWLGKQWAAWDLRGGSPVALGLVQTGPGSAIQQVLAAAVLVKGSCAIHQAY